MHAEVRSYRRAKTRDADHELQHRFHLPTCRPSPPRPNAAWCPGTNASRSTAFPTRCPPLPGANLEPVFHADFYGYRPGKSAVDAVRTAGQRCWRYDFVLDIYVKGFFDSIDWELLLKAVRSHTDSPWVLLNIERWLKAPVRTEDSSIVPKTAGTPQGGVILSAPGEPVPALRVRHVDCARVPAHPVRDYANDAICHCKSEEEARVLWRALAHALRLASWCCIRTRQKSSIARTRTGTEIFLTIAFDFLGFQFAPGRRCGREEGRSRLLARSKSEGADPHRLGSPALAVPSSQRQIPRGSGLDPLLWFEADISNRRW